MRALDDLDSEAAAARCFSSSVANTLDTPALVCVISASTVEKWNNTTRDGGEEVGHKRVQRGGGESEKNAEIIVDIKRSCSQGRGMVAVVRV
jgi:transposase